MGRARAVGVRVACLALAAATAAWALSAYAAVYVGGGSMSPTFVQGDLAVVRRGARGVREGDVVLVSKPHWPGGVLHRVVQTTLDDRLVLRGDANPIPDLDPAPLSDVRGVVIFTIPTGRLLAVVEGVVRMVQSRLT
jgi:signal peptidase I